MLRKSLNLRRAFVLLALLAAPFLFLASPHKAEAAPDTCTWTGAVNGDWNDSGNWTGCDGNLPEASGDSLVFPSLADTYTVINDFVGYSFQSVAVVGDGYAFTGNEMKVLQMLNVNGNDVEFNLDIEIGNASSSSAFNANGENTAISANLIFDSVGQAVTIAGAGNIMMIDGGILTGSALRVHFQDGLTFDTSNVDSSVVTTNAFLITADATFNCRSLLCAGDESNLVLLSGEGTLNFVTDVVGFANPLQIGSEGIVRISDGVEVELDSLVTITGSSASWGVLLGEGSLLSVNGAWDVGTYNVEIIGNTAFDSSIIFTAGGIEGEAEALVSFEDVIVTFDVDSPDYDGEFSARNSFVHIHTVGALGSTTGGTILYDNAIVSISSAGDITLSEMFTVDGEALIGINGNGDVLFTGEIELLNNSLVTLYTEAGDGTLNLQNVISGNGAVNVAALNPITFSGTGSNTFTGTLTLSEGALFLNKDSDGVIAVPSNVIVEADGILYVDGSSEQIADGAVLTLKQGNENAAFVLEDGLTETIGGLAGGTNGIVAIEEESTLIINNAADHTYDGDIYGDQTGTSTLIKQGAGKLTANGDWGVEDSIASVILNAGSLVINGTVTAGELVVNAGKLMGTGEITSVTMAGGSLAPGLSPGILTVTGDITLTNGVSFEVEMNGTTVGSQYDQLVVSGTANLNNATLAISLLDGYVPTVGSTYTIVRAATVTGTFAGLADDARITVGERVFRVDYNLSETGEDTVVLTYLGSTTELANTGFNLIAPLTAGALGLVGSGVAVKRRKQK